MKTRLDVHGYQQYHGVKYTETYAPVEICYIIQNIIMLALLNKWNNRQTYFCVHLTTRTCRV